MTAQELAVTQTLADAAASRSRAAWMVTGRHASYLLAQANTAAIRRPAIRPDAPSGSERKSA
jgi:hypothetical protein